VGASLAAAAWCRALMMWACSWLALNVTTGDVKANCDDLKVLGKGDFKALLKWRTALREEVTRVTAIEPCRDDSCIGFRRSVSTARQHRRTPLKWPT
jgi:hypothetical protein